MRVLPVVGLSLLIAGMSLASSVGSELGATGGPKPRLLSEFRFGLAAQDPWGSEGGSGNLTGEALLAKPFTTADLFTSYFIPRPHLGGSLNFDAKTSFVYAGLTWSIDVTPRIFIEGSFGGATHDGRTNPFSGSYEQAVLGCQHLFRESGSIGVRLSANWSMMATIEHLTDGGTCSAGGGLTNIGARLGYAF
jgi:lipid A 3-O-deacylase